MLCEEVANGTYINYSSTFDSRQWCSGGGRDGCGEWRVDCGGWIVEGNLSINVTGGGGVGSGVGSGFVNNKKICHWRNSSTALQTGQVCVHR
jgi:hypothetical protein